MKQSPRPTLRRLVDLPGVDQLELKALMQPSLASPEALEEHPELDACSQALFGITAAEAAAYPRPEGWDDIELRPVTEQVEAFEREGWDVTNDRRRPLRLLGHFNQQLWLAIRGVAGQLPFHPDAPEPDDWGASLAADAKRFRKR